MPFDLLTLLPTLLDVEVNGSNGGVLKDVPDNAVDFMSGSNCTLLCSRPLRTVRASFPAYGSSLSITPH
ncbi:TPA: DUF1281 domain-containing protein [Escherichia coli]|nr:DUF1281 domain-containing protein [Escherichia coli]EGO4630318.1 DUF1281 domain-containing protein [Escherichia coli]EIV8827875.1 DUF1281 domain-containing protein [Escherichia coli]EJE7200424.1 DUF1281 domain-containing protein [Escherichia coli]EKD7865909.1 DUF1281 domain-containing protein [Escherichia coli]